MKKKCDPHGDHWPAVQRKIALKASRTQRAGLKSFDSTVCIHSDPYEYHIGLCNESCSSGEPAVLPGSDFNFGYYMQTVQPYFPYLPCLYASLTSVILCRFY